MEKEIRSSSYSPADPSLPNHLSRQDFFTAEPLSIQPRVSTDCPDQGEPFVDPDLVLICNRIIGEGGHPKPALADCVSV